MTDSDKKYQVQIVIVGGNDVISTTLASFDSFKLTHRFYRWARKVISQMGELAPGAYANTQLDRALRFGS